MNIVDKFDWLFDYWGKEKFTFFSEENYKESLKLKNVNIHIEEIISDLKENINAGMFPRYIHLFTNVKSDSIYILKELSEKKHWIDISQFSIEEIGEKIKKIITNHPTGRFILISYSQMSHTPKGKKFIPISVQVIGYNPYDFYKKYHYDVYKMVTL